MSKAYKCNRCGDFFAMEENEEHNPVIIVRIEDSNRDRNYFNLNIGPGDIRDLCPKCCRKLEEFLTGEEIP